jgi:hypothetical protein
MKFFVPINSIGKNDNGLKVFGARARRAARWHGEKRGKMLKLQQT